MKPELVLLCGIPGSGKSTYALSRSWTHVIVSSDDIRAELGDVNDQSNNDKVFNIMHERIRNNLLYGNKVIVDATNVKRKYRKRLLDNVNDIDCYKRCVVFLTNVQTCLERNAKRDRKVPEEIIVNMWQGFQFPTLNEGYNKIDIAMEGRGDYGSIFYE